MPFKMRVKEIEEDNWDSDDHEMLKMEIRDYLGWLEPEDFQQVYKQLKFEKIQERKKIEKRRMKKKQQKLRKVNNENNLSGSN